MKIGNKKWLKINSWPAPFRKVIEGMLNELEREEKTTKELIEYSHRIKPGYAWSTEDLRKFYKDKNLWKPS